MRAVIIFRGALIRAFVVISTAGGILSLKAQISLGSQKYTTLGGTIAGNFTVDDLHKW